MLQSYKKKLLYVYFVTFLLLKVATLFIYYKVVVKNNMQN